MKSRRSLRSPRHVSSRSHSRALVITASVAAQRLEASRSQGHSRVLVINALATALTSHPNRNIKDALATLLGVTGRRVQVWFQNQRQRHSERILYVRVIARALPFAERALRAREAAKLVVALPDVEVGVLAEAAAHALLVDHAAACATPLSASRDSVFFCTGPA